MAVWRWMGRACFWLGWPILWFYLHDSKRTRLLLTNEYGEVLVVKGWLTGFDLWALPGGGLHEGEQPKAGLLREVQEEVGILLRSNQIRQISKTYMKSKGFQFHLYIYTAKINGRPKPAAQRFELVEARWIKTNQLTAKTAEPDVLLALAALPGV